ncbi:MAG: acetylxylan esterase [Kiritimatiellae bacterium]|nr:acetylxylan esterase [Kiritimatiellia bacterium]
MNFSKLLSALWIALGVCSAYALPTTAKWNTEELYRTPQSWPCEAFAAKSNQLSVVTESGTVTARYVWLEGLAYKGKPTKFLACYAIPKAADGRSVPAMVCVHGGNGTAYREWVELWAKRGYAAIAMDTCGSIPVRVPGTKFDWISSGIGGPRGWGGFANVNDDIKDQWPYHAVSTVVRSHSFLRAQLGVDPERIGITGLSWGGFLTCLSASVDKRFKLAVPVYTCAFYDTIGSAEERRKTFGDVKWRRWLDLWDPKHYIPEIDMPIMWLSGTNDRSFPYGSLRKTFPLVKAPLDVVIRPRMPHGHTAGWSPKEILAYADSFFKNGLKLPKVSAPTVAGNSTAVKFESGEGFMAPVAAELHYTTADGKWENRLWRCRPARIEGTSAIADMPSGVTAHFINLVFENGLKVSSR